MGRAVHGVSTLLTSASATRAYHSQRNKRAWTPFVSVTSPAHARVPRPLKQRLSQSAESRFAFSVYRDEGTLSEIDIAEFLAQTDAAQLSADAPALFGESPTAISQVSPVPASWSVDGLTPAMGCCVVLKSAGVMFRQQLHSIVLCCVLLMLNRHLSKTQETWNLKMYSTLSQAHKR